MTSIETRIRAAARGQLTMLRFNVKQYEMGFPLRRQRERRRQRGLEHAVDALDYPSVDSVESAAELREFLVELAGVAVNETDPRLLD
ncbi:MAG: hypothetical protein MHM6MM_004972 [Cercozoa sp. M6MM]